MEAVDIAAEMGATKAKESEKPATPYALPVFDIIVFRRKDGAIYFSFAEASSISGTALSTCEIGQLALASSADC